MSLLIVMGGFLKKFLFDLLRSLQRATPSTLEGDPEGTPGGQTNNSDLKKENMSNSSSQPFSISGISFSFAFEEVGEWDEIDLTDHGVPIKIPVTVRNLAPISDSDSSVEQKSRKVLMALFGEGVYELHDQFRGSFSHLRLSFKGSELEVRIIKNRE